MIQLDRRVRRKPGRFIAAGTISLCLIAAACGGDNSDSATTTTAGGATTTAGSATTGRARHHGAPATTAAPNTPVQGGSLVMGIEADSFNPWTPAGTNCAVSCYVIFRSVYDPLALASDDGVITPYLAQSIEPRNNYTEWVITPRAGMTFHDGTPLDGAAIADNLKRVVKSPTTGPSLSFVKGSPSTRRRAPRPTASPSRATAPSCT